MIGFTRTLYVSVYHQCVVEPDAHIRFVTSSARVYSVQYQGRYHNAIVSIC